MYFPQFVYSNETSLKPCVKNLTAAFSISTSLKVILSMQASAPVQQQIYFVCPYGHASRVGIAVVIAVMSRICSKCRM